MPKLTIMVLALALAAPFAGLAVAEVAFAPSRPKSVSATEVARAVHAVLPSPPSAIDQRTGLKRE
jgi:hypothetical protein